MPSSRTLLPVLVALTLFAAPRVHAEHPPSDQRDRSGYEDRSGYDERDQDYRSIHDQVHEALANELGSDADGIRVVERRGVVTLSGWVRNSRSRAIAHDVAHDVPGVRSVTMARLFVGRRR